MKDQDILDHIRSHYGSRVIPEGVSFFNADRKRAASRLVKCGLLERVSGPMGSGWRITPDGLKTKIVTA